jgi:hypothetical protein
MTAYLVNGKVGFWSSDNAESSISSVPAARSPTVVVVFGGDYVLGVKQADFYGYAHENVARVGIRLTDGRQYGAQTVAGWPGSGVRLWAFSVPVRVGGTGIRKVDVIKGYDAAGHVVWQMSLGKGSGG